MELGSNIRNIRKQRGLRQEQLAEAMGVSIAAVSKWETGQSFPELTVLVELADYFEVSIDALMGHQIRGDRIYDVLAQIEVLEDAGEYEKAQELAEKLLGSYPSSTDVISKIAALYYRTFMKTKNNAAMERSIELTKQLLVLEDDPTGARKFERLSNLGNQYAILQNWELARKYYLEGNVGKMNDRALAELLASEGKYGEAIVSISDICVSGIYDLLIDIFSLSACWTRLEKNIRS